MGTEVLKSYDFLQEELDKAKTHLKGLNENIRKIIGRDPQEAHLRLVSQYKTVFFLYDL